MRQSIFSFGSKMRVSFRIALFLLLVFVLFLVLIRFARLLIRIESVRGLLQKVPEDWLLLFLLVIALLTPILIASWVMVRYVDKRPFSSLGLKFHPFWWKELVGGMAFGFTYLTLGTLIPYALGFVKLSWQALNIEQIALIFSWSLMIVLVLATFEELLFRGYLFQTLVTALGVSGATLLMTFSFALSHLATHDLLMILEVWLMGLLFTLVYLKTKSLWMPIGLHFANNFGLYLVGGSDFFSELLKFEAKGLFKGDITGTSGSLLGLLFASLLVLAVLCWKGLQPHPQMEALWQQYIHPAQPWARLRTWWQGCRGTDSA